MDGFSNLKASFMRNFYISFEYKNPIFDLYNVYFKKKISNST